MLIWRGKGFLALVLAIVINLTFNAAADATFGIPPGFKHYRDTHGWLWLAGMLATAVACWFLGIWLEKRALANSKILTDKATGQDVQLLARDDMFWIPVKWWSLVWLAVGLWMMVK